MPSPLQGGRRGKCPFSIAGNREEAWALQGGKLEKERHGKNARNLMKNTRSPSLAFAMEGLSEEGGDLLSRIAVQYHRRARA